MGVHGGIGGPLEGGIFVPRTRCTRFRLEGALSARARPEKFVRSVLVVHFVLPLYARTRASELDFLNK